MKKGIILITLLCSILMYSRVKALALDGTITGQYQLGDSQYTGHFYRTSNYNNTTGTYYFNSCKEPGNADYMVFTIQSLLYTDTTNTFQEHYGNGYTAAYTDVYSLYNRFISQAQPRVQLMSTGVWPVCEIQNNLIVCPLFKNVCYTGIKLELLLPENDVNYNTNWDITISNYANLMKTSTNSIIDSQNQNTQEIVNGTLANTPSQDFTNQTQEINDYATAEDQILNSLDFSGVNETTVTINPNASLFIWNIVNRLRSMSGAIVLLMTSIFGIGIIKLVLNR